MHDLHFPMPSYQKRRGRPLKSDQANRSFSTAFTATLAAVADAHGSQAALARATPLPQSTVARLMSGAVKPTPSSIAALLEACDGDQAIELLRATLNDLLSDVEANISRGKKKAAIAHFKVAIANPPPVWARSIGITDGKPRWHPRAR